MTEINNLRIKVGAQGCSSLADAGLFPNLGILV